MKQWNHHQKGQGNDKPISMTLGLPSRSQESQGALFHCSLANMGHLMNIQKPQLQMLGLSQHAGHLLVSCPCQQDLPSARLHADTCATSTLASCLRARNTGHVCECLTTCDFGEHISSQLLRLSFLQVRYGDFTYFNFRAKGAFGDFGVHPIV